MVDGAYVGGFGDVGILSFNVSKAFSVCTGGALVTNDDEMAASVGLLLKRHSSPGLRAPGGHSSPHCDGNSPPSRGCTPPCGCCDAFAETIISYFRRRPRSPESAIRMPTLHYRRSSSARAENLAWNLERRRRLGDIDARELCDIPGICLQQVHPTVQPAWIQPDIRAR